ncbi:50S ribosomal protein L21 [Candidatus Kaiserbacteria bacterium]|nr:50S ribosomal protein L21 [Candidatus Kaiserbacteria bacterium]
MAVIKTGGKQYLVQEGDVLSVEMLGKDTGSKVTFDDVLLLDDGAATKVGEPTVKGTKVAAEVIETGRGKKINVIRYKQKSRYFKKRGHRQPFTKVKITSIA